MIDPALHAGRQFGVADAPGVKCFQSGMQMSPRMTNLPPLDAPMFREHHEAQPRDAMPDGHHLRLAFVNAQPQTLQALDNGLFPFPKLPFVVAEQREIVDKPATSAVCSASRLSASRCSKRATAALPRFPRAAARQAANSLFQLHRRR